MSSGLLNGLTHIPRLDPLEQLRDVPANKNPVKPSFDSRKPNNIDGVFGGLGAFDEATVINNSIFTAKKSLAPTPVSASHASSLNRLVDGKQQARGGPLSIPDSPFTLNQYLNATGYMPQLAKYTENLEKHIKNNKLTQYEKFQTDENIIGRGSSKTCFDMHDGMVIVVSEKGPHTLPGELHNIKLLEKEGFPVVKIKNAGTLKGRFFSGNGEQSVNSATIQQKIGDFYLFDRAAPKMHKEFLDSPLLNKKTLDSLVLIRKLMKEKGVSIGDLQGGMVMQGPDKGAFRIADPTNLSKASGGDIFEKKRMENLDKLIADVAGKLQVKV